MKWRRHTHVKMSGQVGILTSSYKSQMLLIAPIVASFSWRFQFTLHRSIRRINIYGSYCFIKCMALFFRDGDTIKHCVTMLNPQRHRIYLLLVIQGFTVIFIICVYVMHMCKMPPHSARVYLFIYLFICLFIYYIWAHCSCLQTLQKRASDLIRDGCEPPCGCWDLNSGPSEEQLVLLTTEPSLQP